MESFVDDLKKEVQCSLCNDTFTEPKILPCFHTFCKPCVKRHADLIDEVNVFKCPRCKLTTSLPEPSSVEDLQPSLLHTRILKGLALVEGEKICSVSESHSTASWYCFDCDRSMCEECKKYHSEFTKDHKVVRLADLEQEDIGFIITRENPCKSHPHHRLELFCEDCDDMICRTCLIHDHKDHETMLLDELASRKKTVLSKYLKAIENLMLNDKEKQEQEEIAYNIKQQGDKALKQIQEKTKEMIDTLREKERELIKQVLKSLEKAERNLNIIHHMPAVKEYINRIMERGLASEMINYIQETQCSEDYILNPISRYSRIVFVPNEKLMEEVYAGLGEIQSYSETDHTMSFIQVEYKPAVALRRGKLKLISRSCIGEIISDPLDVIDVQIKPEENVKIEKKYVRTDSKVEVEFMAKVAGQLTAEVQVNGNHVSNSPLVVNVKPQEINVRMKLNLEGPTDTQPKLLNGIAVNRKNSRVAVAYESAHCVHVFTTDGDLLLTYGSRGSAQGQLSNPEGLAFLNDTDLVISDNGNHRICIVNTTTGTLVKTFGNHGNGDGEFRYPWGVHVDNDGNIIVCDRNNHRVQVFTRDGDYQYQFGLTTQDKFDPISTVSHGERFYVIDTVRHVIHVFEKKGNIMTGISTIGGEGSADGQLKRPWGLAIDKKDHLLLVCDHENDRIQKFTLDGRLVGKTCNEVDHPAYITVMNDGQLLLTSYIDGVYMSFVDRGVNR